MARRGNGISLLALLLLGSALLLNERGDVIGRAQERRGGYVDLFNADSTRAGWGRVRGDTIELFDVRGNRIGTWQRERGVIRLERP